MTAWDETQERLRNEPRRWLVTGAAGFIGSHLVQTLLDLGQEVTGLDNFATGRTENLDDVQASMSASDWARFAFVEGDITRADDCARACEGADYVLHQAALGSVPRSIANPLASAAANVDGFIQIVLAARDAGARRLVYASSSSVYGDHPGLPKVEERIGTPLSPYAVTKYADELLAGVFGRVYSLPMIGLRYFNIFGPRQDPEGPYAAVIPRWIDALLEGRECTVFGDGETSRDFTFVANAVQANLLAATCDDPAAVGGAFNVAIGGQVSLVEIYTALHRGLAERRPERVVAGPRPLFDDFRAGDVRHSRASVSKARRLLGYEPTHDVEAGLAETLDWYVTRRGDG